MDNEDHQGKSVIYDSVKLGIQGHTLKDNGDDDFYDENGAEKLSKNEELY